MLSNWHRHYAHLKAFLTFSVHYLRTMCWVDKKNTALQCFILKVFLFTFSFVCIKELHTRPFLGACYQIIKIIIKIILHHNFYFSVAVMIKVKFVFMCSVDIVALSIANKQKIIRLSWIATGKVTFPPHRF